MFQVFGDIYLNKKCGIPKCPTRRAKLGCGDIAEKEGEMLKDFLMKQIINKVGWIGLILIILFISIYSYALLKKKKRISNALYTTGLSLGIQEGVHGSFYLYYTFQIDNQKFSGNVPDDFCQKCLDCCNSGATVIVRYQRDNPDNNDLVSELPEGDIIEK